jgi:ATP-GRASP peptide maturase of grasp-with-spasm system
MILLITDENDQTINEIVDWLYFFNKKFKRVNRNSKNRLLEYSLNNENLYFIIENNEVGIIDSREIKSCWFRRGDLNFQDLNFDDYFLCDKDLTIDLIHYLATEISFLHRHFIDFLINSDFFTLGNYDYHNNKLNILFHAKKVGLKIPNTHILTSNDSLKDFSNLSLVSKGIQNSITVNSKNYSVYSYTELLTDVEMNSKQTDFFPTLIQENISKLFEVRVFYLNGKCFSMAIFSQSDSQTNVDFRKYNWENPNRNVLFKLPPQIEDKIVKLMRSINLNTGSLDFIYSKENEFIFLEVNPVGQFGFVSILTNQNLFKEVAKIL